MPKNWTVNTKSAQAKAQKNAIRTEEYEKKQKELEDKMWQDDDKHLQKKQQRKEEAEKKEKERLEKKLEAKKLLDEEMSKLKSAKPDKTESKMTKFDIDRIKELQEKSAAVAAAVALQGNFLKLELSYLIETFISNAFNFEAQKKLETPEEHLLENVNRLTIEGEVARDVEQAISILK
jgi:hypothetical protein